MSEVPRVPGGGATVVAATWAAAGAVHAVLAFGATGAPTVVGAALAAAAVVGVVALLRTGRPAVLVAAGGAGAIGVAGFLIPLVAALLGFGSAVVEPLDPWVIGGFLLDALTARLAVFTLRRTSRVQR